MPNPAGHDPQEDDNTTIPWLSLGSLLGFATLPPVVISSFRFKFFFDLQIHAQIGGCPANAEQLVKL